MTCHFTLRLAWHNDGWNGRICKDPAKNTYCVGCSSYPGEMIRESRDLAWEKENAGKKFSELDRPAACMYSGSAFSEDACEIIAEPPEFFNDDTEVKHWTIPAATACTWPYEAMYTMPGVKKGNSYDYEKRLHYAEEYFKPVEKDRSLVFYYANYSNPLSDDETSRYVLVGVARIKEVAPILYYDNCDKRTLEKYKGFVWQRGITSHYPEQGFRLPYHRYINKPEILQQFAAYPENVALCKYATRPVTDDDALGLLEQLLESARIVRDDIQDESENWNQHIQWLEGLIAELWKNRGAHPGMPEVLHYLGLSQMISGFKSRVEAGDELSVVDEVIQFCEGKTDFAAGFYPLDEELPDLRRRIQLKAEGKLDLLLRRLSRISLKREQLSAILSDDRQKVGVDASLEEIGKNPYLLAEEYAGADAGDSIRWSTVDRAMLPSPEVAAKPLFSTDAKERLRSLILETIRSFSQQTFVPAVVLLERVNARMKIQPEWKRTFLTEQYLKVDGPFYSEAIYLRQEQEKRYLYDLRVWNDERLVETVLNDLLTASDISLKHPVNETFWRTVLFKEGCDLAKNARQEYEKAISVQVSSCQQILTRRVAAITGGAGTGKSTVVAALIKAIRKAHGEGTGIAVIAPTGKATDRLRQAFKETEIKDVGATTIHALLAEHGWLNDNLTFRLKGGKRVDKYSTIIIDESSMIDLSLMAALFRAIDWGMVGRLILVGDAAQLPPIGTGKVYADIVSQLRSGFPDHYAELTENLRQLENRANGNGCAILDLASCFINSVVRGDREESEEQSARRERLLIKLHEGGDVDKDLKVVYWNDQESLADVLIDQITEDFRPEDDVKVTPERILGNALKDNINAMQVLSPVRGELFGTEHLNRRIQAFKSGYWLKRGDIDGITMFDKVIQIRNVPKNNLQPAYNFDTRSQDKVQLFNGEIGGVVPTGKWTQFLQKSKWERFRIKEFSVQFFGKKHLSVNYGGNTGNKPEGNLELAYAISVHKAQGSEFQRVYFVLPSSGLSIPAMELIYTALTRASVHCTLLVEGSVESIVNCMRPEQSALKSIASSLFTFKPVNEFFATKRDWYEAGKIHAALTGEMVRSKSEVIIANMLHERGINFWYEKPLIASDGTMYLPDFTVVVRGEEYYWEHVGMLGKPSYKMHWQEKKAWYEKQFPGRLFTTEEGADLSLEADSVIKELQGK